MSPDPTGLSQARAVYDSLFATCHEAVRGRDPTIRLLLVALIADGHVLLEDHPGSGKTTLAKTLGLAIANPSPTVPEPFRRVQFTPDLLASDITGTMVLDPGSGAWRFHQGPIFTNVLLADEINRAGPKVQAALLEGMAEQQVTIDGRSHPLDELFFVVATQNPYDSVGTYPLSRAQLDRFLFKIRMTQLDRASQLEVLSRHDPLPASGAPQAAIQAAMPDAPIQAAALLEARLLVREGVFVSGAVKECLVDIARALRADPRIQQGISTRSLVDAVPALQAWAMTEHRDFVSFQDLKALAIPLFLHRLIACVGLQNAESVVREIVGRVLERYIRRTLASA